MATSQQGDIAAQEFSRASRATRPKWQSSCPAEVFAVAWDQKLPRHMRGSCPELCSVARAQRSCHKPSQLPSAS